MQGILDIIDFILSDSTSSRDFCACLCCVSAPCEGNASVQQRAAELKVETWERITFSKHSSYSDQHTERPRSCSNSEGSNRTIIPAAFSRLLGICHSNRSQRDGHTENRCSTVTTTTCQVIQPHLPYYTFFSSTGYLSPTSALNHTQLCTKRASLGFFPPVGPQRPGTLEDSWQTQQEGCWGQVQPSCSSSCHISPKQVDSP